MGANTFDIGQLGMQAATDLTQGVLGIVAGGVQDKRQIKQQQKLTDMQLTANKNMSEFNYGQQMKLWEATNYGPQMEQLKKAGLNPGLIYAQGGPGGTTQAAQGQGVTGGHAPGGTGMEIFQMMQMKNQQELIKAQTENLRADANLKNVDANKTAGVDTELGHTQISSLKQGIQNAKAQQALTEIETSLKKIEEGYKDQREGYTNEILAQQIDNMAQQWVKIKYENDITKETWQSAVKQIHQEAINTVITGELMKSGIQKNAAEIKKISQEIISLDYHSQMEQFYGETSNYQLSQKDKELMIKDAEQKIQQKLIETQIPLQTTDRILRGVETVGQGLSNISKFKR